MMSVLQTHDNELWECVSHSPSTRTVCKEWFLSFFASFFPPEQVVPIWDRFLIASPDLFGFVALAVISLKRPQLLECDDCAHGDCGEELQDINTMDISKIVGKTVELCHVGMGMESPSLQRLSAPETGLLSPLVQDFQLGASVIAHHDIELEAPQVHLLLCFLLLSPDLKAPPTFTRTNGTPRRPMASGPHELVATMVGVKESSPRRSKWTELASRHHGHTGSWATRARWSK